MRPTSKGPLRLLPPALLLAAMLAGAVTIQSCAVGTGNDEGAAAATAGPAWPLTPSMNHELHGFIGLECGFCHDPDEDGEPALPAIDLCWGCHDPEALEDEPENLRVYLDAIRQEDGSYEFPKAPYSPGLKVNHAGHAEYGLDCADCHGEPAATRFPRPDAMELKASCMGCHEMGGVSNECATCHEALRRDVMPESHTAAFRRNHGAQAPEGWQTGETELNTCGMCHEIPQSCNLCHEQTPPQSHREAGFRRFHGAGYTDAADVPFEQSSCALCHEEQSCVRCHQSSMPQSHTSPWRRRLHGIDAEVDRQTCRTCHQQDFCQRCHETAQPVTHTGGWGSGAQAHCVACHDPLPTTTCYTCHKDTLGHLQATPLPPGPPHATAQTCSTCHPVIPHFDDGLSCRRCHK